MIHAIHAVVVVVHTRWLEHLLSVMHHWHFNHLCRTGWAEHYEHLILSSALHAVTNSCSHLKDKWSPRLSENDFALIMSGRSMQFFMTVPVKEVLWKASDCSTGMLVQYRSIYMMAAIEVTPHKVHDNRTRLREWLRFWASFVSAPVYTSVSRRYQFLESAMLIALMPNLTVIFCAYGLASKWPQNPTMVSSMARFLDG